MPRPMSFSDRQYFVQTLAECRNLSIACETAQSHDTELRRRCEGLIAAVDSVAGELVGDDAYFKVVEVHPKA